MIVYAKNKTKLVSTVSVHCYIYSKNEYYPNFAHKILKDEEKLDKYEKEIARHDNRLTYC